MDPNRFDQMTKTMATRQTRRGVLRTLGGGIVAGLAALGIGGADAAPGGKGKGNGTPGGGGGGNRCGGPGQPCKWNKQCCEFAGLVCLDGSCTCLENTCASGECHGACPVGKHFNPDICSCECSETPACNDRQVFNTETCACDCAPCPDGKLLNGETCACTCPRTNSCCSCYNASTEAFSCTTGVTDTECELFCSAQGGSLSSYDDTGVFLFEGCTEGFCGIVCESDFPSFPD